MRVCVRLSAQHLISLLVPNKWRKHDLLPACFCSFSLFSFFCLFFNDRQKKTSVLNSSLAFQIIISGSACHVLLWRSDKTFTEKRHCLVFSCHATTVYRLLLSFLLLLLLLLLLLPGISNCPFFRFEFAPKRKYIVTPFQVQDACTKKKKKRLKNKTKKTKKRPISCYGSLTMNITDAQHRFIFYWILFTVFYRLHSNFELFFFISGVLR